MNRLKLNVLLIETYDLSIWSVESQIIIEDISIFIIHRNEVEFSTFDPYKLGKIFFSKTYFYMIDSSYKIVFIEI